MDQIGYYASPLGIIKLKEKDGFLVELSFTEDKDIDKQKSKDSILITEVKKQLEEYFSGKRFDFDVPLKQDGTPFQMKAWEYLRKIPYGKTISYKAEAEAIGHIKAFRAIGSANGCNNIAIIVPCHRVVNSNGELGGYAYGLNIKKELLELEKKYSH